MSDHSAAPAVIRLHPLDNVVVATRAIEAGQDVGEVLTAHFIPSGHKIAVRPIKRAMPF